MRTETITYWKENANNLWLDEKFAVTKNAKAAFVVQSIDDFEHGQETLALLNLLKLFEKLLYQSV